MYLSFEILPRTSFAARAKDSISCQNEQDSQFVVATIRLFSLVKTERRKIARSVNVKSKDTLGARLSKRKRFLLESLVPRIVEGGPQRCELLLWVTARHKAILTCMHVKSKKVNLLMPKKTRKSRDLNYSNVA